MRNKTRSLIGVVTFIISVYIVFRLLAFPAGLFSATFIGGLVVWMLTTYRVSVDPGVIVVPHLVTVILFIVHVYEEFVAHGGDLQGPYGHIIQSESGPAAPVVKR